MGLKLYGSRDPSTAVVGWRGPVPAGVDRVNVWLAAPMGKLKMEEAVLVTDGKQFQLAALFERKKNFPKQLLLGRNADQCDIRIPANDRVRRRPNVDTSSLLTVSRVHAR